MFPWIWERIKMRRFLRKMELMNYMFGDVKRERWY